jgi:ribosomal protein S14
MTAVTTTCRLCGTQITGVINRDIFPARIVDSQTGRELRKIMLCRVCFEAPEEL